MGVGGAGGGLDLLDRGVGPAVGDVVADRDREEEGLVEHDADVVRAATASVTSRTSWPSMRTEPSVDVVEAGQQPRDRRLARTGAPDDRDGLAGRDVGVEVA